MCVCVCTLCPYESTTYGRLPSLSKHMWSFQGLVIIAPAECYGICYVHMSVLVYVDACVGTDLQQSPMDVVVLDFGSGLWRKLLQ